MTLRNTHRERGVDAPRRLTAAEQAAVEARRPLRYAAARNVARAVQLTFPEVFEPAPQVTTQVAAPAMSNVVSLDAYRAPEQAQTQVQPETADEPQAEMARQAIANIFNPEQDVTDVKEAA